MSELNVFCQQFEEQFVSWASANPDIRAAVVVGSIQARIGLSNTVQDGQKTVTI